MQSFPVVQHFSQVDAWTLNGPQRHLDPFISQTCAATTASLRSLLMSFLLGIAHTCWCSVIQVYLTGISWLLLTLLIPMKAWRVYLVFPHTVSTFGLVLFLLAWNENYGKPEKRKRVNSSAPLIVRFEMLTIEDMHQHACKAANMQEGTGIINHTKLLININGVSQNYTAISLHSNHLDFMPLSAGSPVNFARGELQWALSAEPLICTYLLAVSY